MHLPIRLLMFLSTVCHDLALRTLHRLLRLSTDLTRQNLRYIPRSPSTLFRPLTLTISHNQRHHILNLLPRPHLALALVANGIDPYIDEWLVHKVKPRHGCLEDFDGG